MGTLYYIVLHITEVRICPLLLGTSLVRALS